MLRKTFVQFLVLLHMGLSMAIFDPQQHRFRIVNGIESSISKTPYQVSLRHIDSVHFCGGAILSDYWIITAAQCTQQKSAQDIIVVVGASNLSESAYRYGLEKIVDHPQYDWERRLNDISMLKTDQPMEMWQRSVFPVALTSFKTNYIIENGIGLTTVVLSGWGSIKVEESEENTELSETLRSQESYILARTSCRRHLGRVNGLLLNENHLCTNVRNGEGMCIGDVGSPLVTSNGEIVGIASWRGSRCGAGYPDVYTRVYQYQHWIWGNLMDN